jgi:hypothetical protein
VPGNHREILREFRADIALHGACPQCKKDPQWKDSAAAVLNDRLRADVACGQQLRTLQTYVNVLSSTASGGQGFGRAR